MEESVVRSTKSPAWKWAVIAAVSLVFIGWLLNTPEGLLGKADAVGYAVCHRIDLRSFHISARPMPLCARCSGMYLGAVLGLAYQAWLSPRRGGMPGRKMGILWGLLAGLFVLDGLNSFASLFPGVPSLYPPQNWLRLFTGTGMGLVIAAYLYPAFNQTAWKNWRAEPALASARQVAGLFGLAVILVLAVLSNSPALLYPLALISAVGVLTILCLAYTTLGLILFKQENRFESIVQLALPLAAGFGVAILQIAVLDYLRFAATGTWEGFHLVL